MSLCFNYRMFKYHCIDAYIHAPQKNTNTNTNTMQQLWIKWNNFHMAIMNIVNGTIIYTDLIAFDLHLWHWEESWLTFFNEESWLDGHISLVKAAADDSGSFSLDYKPWSVLIEFWSSWLDFFMLVTSTVMQLQQKDFQGPIQWRILSWNKQKIFDESHFEILVMW